MGSRSWSCQLTEATFLLQPQLKLVLSLLTPEGWKAELTWAILYGYILLKVIAQVQAQGLKPGKFGSPHHKSNRLGTEQLRHDQLSDRMIGCFSVYSLSLLAEEPRVNNNNRLKPSRFEMLVTFVCASVWVFCSQPRYSKCCQMSSRWNQEPCPTSQWPCQHQATEILRRTVMRGF